MVVCAAQILLFLLKYRVFPVASPAPTHNTDQEHENDDVPDSPDTETRPERLAILGPYHHNRTSIHSRSRSQSPCRHRRTSRNLQPTYRARVRADADDSAHRRLARRFARPTRTGQQQWTQKSTTADAITAIVAVATQQIVHRRPVIKLS